MTDQPSAAAPVEPAPPSGPPAPSGARDAAPPNAWITPVLALSVTAGFFGVLAFVLGRPDSATGVATTLLGVLGTAWVAIIGFYFGSSTGSQLKTQLLAERTKPD